MGDGTIFHADVRKDGHYTCKRMVYAEMFYGGGWHPPSTRVLNIIAYAGLGAFTDT